MEETAVLLADDHAVVRTGIRTALQEMPGVQIVGEVADGSALPDALATRRPDLLLIDVAMPDFEPLSAIAEIRQRYPELKILVVSAHDDDLYVQGLMAAGVHGYHLKDQPLRDLRLAVRRVLAGERWISSRVLDKLLAPEPPTGGISLTARQQDILELLLQGLDNRRIALETGLSIKTIENHLTRLYRELNVQSRLEAVSYVHQHPELLPRERGEKEHRPVAHAPTILLVDDNARYRGQLRRLVARLAPQAAIHEAESIDEAIRLARRTEPRLALVDVVLGDENGLECARALKSAVSATRVVLISAYPDREFRRQGLASGASAFIDKKDLDAATVRQILEDVIP